MGEFSDKDFKKLLTALKSLNNEIPTKVTSDVKKAKTSAKKVEDDISKTLQTVKDLLTTSRQEKTDVRKVKETADKSSDVVKEIDRDSSKLFRTLNYVDNMTKALRQGFSSFAFALAGDSPRAGALLNILSAGIDIFNRIEEKVTSANTVFIRGYASLGDLASLDVGSSSVRVADLQSVSSKYGFLNEEANAAFESFITSGGNIKDLESDYYSFGDGAKKSVVTGFEVMSIYARALGVELTYAGELMGKMGQGLGSYKKNMTDNVVYLSNAHKLTKINSKSFIDTVYASAESASVYGDTLQSSSVYLAYLAGMTKSAGNALELYNATNSTQEGDDLRLASLSDVFASGKTNEFARDIRASLESRLSKVTSGTQEHVFLSDLLGGVDALLRGDNSNKTETLLLLNKPGVLDSFHTQALDVLASQMVPENQLAIYAQAMGKNLPLLLAMHGKSYAEMKSTYDQFSKKAADTSKMAGERALQLQRGMESITTKDLLSNTAENFFLKQLGPTIYGVSMGIKNLFAALGSNQLFKDVFSPNMTDSKFYKLMFDQAEKFADSWGERTAIKVGRWLTDSNAEHVANQDRALGILEEATKWKVAAYEKFRENNKEMLDFLDKFTGRTFGIEDFNQLGKVAVSGEATPLRKLLLEQGFDENSVQRFIHDAYSGMSHSADIMNQDGFTPDSSIFDEKRVVALSNELDLFDEKGLEKATSNLKRCDEYLNELMLRLNNYSKVRPEPVSVMI